MARKRRKQSKKSQPPRSALIIGASILLVVALVIVLRSLSGLGSANPLAGDVAPTAQLATLEGGLVTVPDNNYDATVVYAMAYWCGTCIPEARALARLRSEYGAALNVVVVDIDPSSTPSLLQQFIQVIGSNDMTWTFDSDGSFAQAYGIRILDTTIILNNEGREVYRDARPTDYNTLRDQLERLLNT
jgi:thiol-disulfide isomerase/thioredoxin